MMNWPPLGRSLALVLLAMSLAGGCRAEAPSIERLEPPFWWQGFKHTELQLSVYGPGIGSLEPLVDYPGVRVGRVERVASPNYLFVYLQIDPSARPGTFQIRFGRGDAELVHEYTLRERNNDPDWARGFDAADAIYLITPDRFVNGDPGNDDHPVLADEPDREALCGRHGGDIAGILQRLDYIEGMGFTAIWLNPVLENAMPQCSYHGYSATDFYRVDPRYGSNEEYRQLVAAARARGIGVIMDMIVNHIGSGHWWMDDLPAKDWLNFPEQRPITSHVKATIQDPYASQYDIRAFTHGWFVDTMPDLNQRNPLLGDYLVQNALWWIEYLGLAGIRMDTHPYPDKHYMTEWTRRVMEEYPDFNIVGEEWHGNPVIVSYWQRGKQNPDGYVSYLPSVMDFPLQENLAKSLVAEVPDWGSSWNPVYETLAMDKLYPDPGALVIFPDNHDMSRIFTQLDEDYDLWRMAMVYVLTMRGVPQIYYGTEILMHNRGSSDHGLIRSDFPGGWAGDAVDAFSGKGLGEQQLAAQTLTRRLLNWRQSQPVVHHGRLMQFAPFGEIYAYFRYDDSDAIMVIFNKGREAAAVDPARFVERLGAATTATDVLTGETVRVDRAIPVPPRGTLLLEID
jgi:glycosidase